MKKIAVLLIFLCFFAKIFAQEIGFPFIRNYSPKEYDNSPQVFALIQDSKGLMYFGMADGGGILEYDSKKWKTIEIPNKTTVYSLEIDKKDKIYVGLVGDFGYLQNNKEGKKEFVSLKSLIPNKKFGGINYIKIIENKVYFLASDVLFEYISLPKPQINAYSAQKNNKFLGLIKHQNKIYVHQSNLGLMKLGKDSLELLSDFYKDRSKIFRTGFSFSEDSILLASKNGGLYFYNFRNNFSTILPIEDSIFFKNNAIYFSTFLNQNHIALAGLDKGLLLISKTGKTLQNWNEKKLLQNDKVYYAYESTKHNLWLGLGNGISRSESVLAWNFWDKNAGLKGCVTDILRFENQIYLTTFNGIYYLEKGQIKEVGGIQTGQCWDLLEYTTADQKKILLAGTHHGIFEIKNKQAIQLRRGGHADKIYVLPSNPNRIIAVDMPNLVSMIYENGSWKDEGIWEGIEGDIGKILEDKNGDIWIGTYDAGLIRVTPNWANVQKPKKIITYQEQDGLPSLRSVFPYWIQNKLVFGTEKGFYFLNPKNNRFEPHCEISTQFCKNQDIYRVYETEKRTWILPLKNKIQDMGYLQGKQWVYKPFRRLPQMELWSLYEEQNGVVWIGGSEGLFSYDEKKDLKDYESGFYTLIRKVILGKDSIVYHGNSTESEIGLEGINNAYNDLKFEFAATFFDDESKTLYSHQLEGFDKNWSEWSSASEKEYTNLYEGTYIFKVKAKNLYGKESTVASYKIQILPPFYRSFWAYIFYVILSVLSIWAIVKWNTRRLQKDKERLEQIIEERTAEIKEKNVELEQQQEEIKQTLDIISEQKGVIEEQHKDFMDSLNVAKRIQKAILPFKNRMDQTLGSENHFVLFKPRDVVSGDFYFFEDLGEKQVFIVADCTGHGVPGAFVSMIGYNLLSDIVIYKKKWQPELILTELQKALIYALQQKETEGKEGMDLVVLTLDKNTKKAYYSGAMNPLFYVQNQTFFEIKATKKPIGGISKSEKNYELHEIDLNTETVFYLCSDGYQDQFGGEQNRKFMTANLKKLFLSVSEKSMAEQEHILSETFENWKKTGKQKQIDDVSILGIKTPKL